MNTTSTLTKPLIALAFVAASALSWWPMEAQAVRLKEIAAVQGVRSNQLMGYGLVVGLDGTGDQTTQTPFTTQSLTAMLQQMGVNLPAGTNGMRTIVNDYTEKVKVRKTLITTLWSVCALLIILGTLVIFTFDPCPAGAAAELLPSFCPASN